MYGALEAHCTCNNVETWRYRALEVLRACGRGRMEALRPGALEASCRCNGVEEWSPGALKARYRRSDGEAQRYGTLEARCRCVDVEA